MSTSTSSLTASVDVFLRRDIPKIQRKSELLNELNKIHKVLGDISQDPSERPCGLSEFSQQLVTPKLLNHSDKHVKLLTCCCLLDIFRVYAPDFPFSNEIIVKIFDVIGTILSDISSIDPISGTSSKLFYMLSSLATIKSCVIPVILMQDGVEGAEEVVVKMFEALITSLRPDHGDDVVGLIGDILFACIYEMEVIGQDILDVLLYPLLPQSKVDNPTSYQLLCSILSKLSSKLSNPIERLVNQILIGNIDAAESDLSENLYPLIFELHKISPTILYPVLPSICYQLHSDDEDVRFKAVKLLGKLFASPQANYPFEFQRNFKDFLGRLVDVSSSVRLEMIKQLEYIVKSKPLLFADIEDPLVKRLRDGDSDVRLQTLHTIFSLSQDNPLLFSVYSWKEVGQRIVDKKVEIRKLVLLSISKLYKKHFSSKLLSLDSLSSTLSEKFSSYASISSSWFFFPIEEWINAINQAQNDNSNFLDMKSIWERWCFVPGLIVKCWGYPDVSTQHLVLHCFQENILPTGLETSDEDSVRLTSFLIAFSSFDDAERRSFFAIMYFKVRLRQIFGNFLSSWKKLSNRLQSFSDKKNPWNSSKSRNGSKGVSHSDPNNASFVDSETAEIVSLEKCFRDASVALVELVPVLMTNDQKERKSVVTTNVSIANKREEDILLLMTLRDYRDRSIWFQLEKMINSIHTWGEYMDDRSDLALRVSSQSSNLSSYLSHLCDFLVDPGISQTNMSVWLNSHSQCLIKEIELLNNWKNSTVKGNRKKSRPSSLTSKTSEGLLERDKSNYLLLDFSDSCYPSHSKGKRNRYWDDSWLLWEMFSFHFPSIFSSESCILSISNTVTSLRVLEMFWMEEMEHSDHFPDSQKNSSKFPNFPCPWPEDGFSPLERLTYCFQIISNFSASLYPFSSLTILSLSSNNSSSNRRLECIERSFEIMDEFFLEHIGSIFSDDTINKSELTVSYFGRGWKLPRLPSSLVFALVLSCKRYFLNRLFFEKTKTTDLPNMNEEISSKLLALIKSWSGLFSFFSTINPSDGINSLSSFQAPWQQQKPWDFASTPDLPSLLAFYAACVWPLSPSAPYYCSDGITATKNSEILTKDSINPLSVSIADLVPNHLWIASFLKWIVWKDVQDYFKEFFWANRSWSRLETYSSSHSLVSFQASCCFWALRFWNSLFVAVGLSMEELEITYFPSIPPLSIGGNMPLTTLPSSTPASTIFIPFLSLTQFFSDLRSLVDILVEGVQSNGSLVIGLDIIDNSISSSLQEVLLESLLGLLLRSRRYGGSLFFNFNHWKIVVRGIASLNNSSSSLHLISIITSNIHASPSGVSLKFLAFLALFANDDDLAVRAKAETILLWGLRRSRRMYMQYISNAANRMNDSNNESSSEIVPESDSVSAARYKDSLLPENILPYVMILLSYHPLFPCTVELKEEEDRKRMSNMLQSVRMVLRCLLQSAGGEGENIAYLFKQMSNLTQLYEDRHDSSNIGVHLIVKLTLRMLEESIKTSDASQPYPGEIILPQEFFRRQRSSMLEEMKANGQSVGYGDGKRETNVMQNGVVGYENEETGETIMSSSPDSRAFENGILEADLDAIFQKLGKGSMSIGSKSSGASNTLALGGAILTEKKARRSTNTSKKQSGLHRSKKDKENFIRMESDENSEESDNDEESDDENNSSDDEEYVNKSQTSTMIDRQVERPMRVRSNVNYTEREVDDEEVNQWDEDAGVVRLSQGKDHIRPEKRVPFDVSYDNYSSL